MSSPWRLPARAAPRGGRALEILELVAARQGGRVSGAAVRRPEAARRHRPGAGVQAVRAAQRRGNVRDWTPKRTTQILDLIRQLSKDLGLTVLLITHEMDVVKRICDSAAVMSRAGPDPEQGPVEKLLTTEKSLLGQALFPLGDIPETSNAIVEITFTGVTTDRPVIAQLARQHGIDVGILGAAVETIHGRQTGGPGWSCPAKGGRGRAVADLRSQGLFVEVIK